MNSEIQYGIRIDDLNECKVPEGQGNSHVLRLGVSQITGHFLRCGDRIGIVTSTVPNPRGVPNLSMRRKGGAVSAIREVTHIHRTFVALVLLLEMLGYGWVRRETETVS
eukprot:COSAG02_NODE_772_length_17359_cov_74.661587_16_plen_109_part_00